MPTATPFTALGGGNGFSRCIDKVNVSSYPLWTTLSGVNQSSPSASDSDIAESRRLAMKLFWNSYHVGGKANNPDFSLDFPMTIGGSNQTTQAVKIVGGLGSSFDPRDRSCYRFISCFQSKIDPAPFNNDLFSAGFYTQPVALYNGSTGDASNLVGYSIKGRTARWSNESGFASVELYDSSTFTVYGSVHVGYYSTSSSSFPPNVERAYTTMSGGSDTFNFVCIAFSSSGTVSASNRTSDANGFYEMSLTDLNFYTYS
jgi:hypothetical protein